MGVVIAGVVVVALVVAGAVVVAGGVAGVASEQLLNIIPDIRITAIEMNSNFLTIFISLLVLVVKYY